MYGRRAMKRALLTASASARWLAALRPVRRRGALARRPRPKLHRVGDNLGLVLLALVPLPAAGFDAALNVGGASLFEVLAAELRELPEHHNVMELNLLLLGAVGLFIHAVGRQAKTAHLSAAR